jgi:hypothetical protein
VHASLEIHGVVTGGCTLHGRFEDAHGEHSASCAAVTFRTAHVPRSLHEKLSTQVATRVRQCDVTLPEQIGAQRNRLS